jgi:hypothetical protein
LQLDMQPEKISIAARLATGKISVATWPATWNKYICHLICNCNCNLTCNWKKSKLQLDLQLQKSQLWIANRKISGGTRLELEKPECQLDLQLEKILGATAKRISVATRLANRKNSIATQKSQLQNQLDLNHGY